MYKIYQPNVKANKKHACDCVVRAISVTTGKSWQEVYDLLCAKGRKLQCMPNAKPTWKEVLRDLGFVLHSIKVERGSKRPTAATFTKSIKGMMIVQTAHHLIGCKGGDVYDSWDSSETPAYSYWILV